MGRRSEARSRRRRATSRPEHPVAPGTLAIDPQAPAPVVRVMAFGPEGFEEAAGFVVGPVQRMRKRWPVVWVNVIGLGDAAALQEIADEFGLPPLALTDVVETYKRPKIERMHGIVQMAIRIIDDVGSSDTEQLTVFTGEGFVLSFEERKGDLFDVVRERIREDNSYTRNRGADFLAYQLLDMAVDAFFPVIEGISQELEDIEDGIPTAKPLDLTARLRSVKHRLLGLRRALWPMREVLGALASDASPVFTDETRAYLRDCQGHCAQLIDIVTTNRELATDIADLQISVAGQRLGEVTKVLTVIATIFIPMTFVASIYGMNFEPDASRWNMPELRWAFGYPFALATMAAIALGMVIFFRRRGWW